MHELASSWQSFDRFELSKEEALEEHKGNPYKQELIEEFAKEGQTLTVYQSGGTYRDLCRGGHCDNPSKELKYFKLLSLAGAYWRGSERNKMLTRIYGTCFSTKDELQKYLIRLEEAKKRDHKILGPKLDLFTFSDKVGKGLPLWTPKGTLVRNLLDDFVWQLRREKGYVKVEIPHITKKDLYETSGHWDKFKEELFHINTREGHEFAIKPMNCPHHTQIFDRKPHSYREMPQRYATTTMVYRDEQSGELAGLSRVRCITQDDAHVFCREDQVKQEALAIWEIVEAFYRGTGFPKLSYRLSLHDPDHFEKYLGTRKAWAYAENQLRDILTERGVEYAEAVGEAAFYGPKIDFISKDSLGREWQVATIQVDRNMPDRFDLSCINEQGEHERIVMIHAAIMGSIERFMSILIEHYGGAFPLWLSPVQAAVVPVSNAFDGLAQDVQTALRESGIRSELDVSNKTLSAKIRDWTLQKVPYLCIIGGKEQEKRSTDGILYVSIRTREGKDMGMVPLSEFMNKLRIAIEKKSI
ncbi:threonine--tRNA ligase [Candidatus Roizmanbacteria bacterium CG10_big_fil_rev_8_21_14_0_10_45_7]|uniref:Threonine--tRNA ligase n=1 Tax=Candidatus Roizmanbacteria bacterium CG10_big_fil_rev_8_21_14_0_10_45_7 TaxID=1974854 RepID=A0A2M8KTW5_9BACT|nr:MAG: threonine--tRNA ligase [Candidatus Roizmanbacteria bacterium CG10_big_fil_rev_8_21_14_0_10_45_7]